MGLTVIFRPVRRGGNACLWAGLRLV